MKTISIVLLLLSACTTTSTLDELDAAPTAAAARSKDETGTVCSRRWYRSGDTWCMIEDCCTGTVCTSTIVPGSCGRFGK